MGKATQDLRNEHEAILNVLKITEKMLKKADKNNISKIKFGQNLVNFLKIFADKCHHGKEEGFLFIEMIRHGVKNEGGPIGVMLQEHSQGRQLIVSMSAALEKNDLQNFIQKTNEYISLLRGHIAKENGVLFPMADNLLDDALQDEIFGNFERHEETVIGHGVHEQLHAMIHQWEEDLKEK